MVLRSCIDALIVYFDLFYQYPTNFVNHFVLGSYSLIDYIR